MKTLAKITRSFLFGLILVAAGLIMTYHLLLIDIPNVSQLKSYNPSHSSFMNVDVSPLTVTDPRVQKFVPYNKIPKSILRAVLVAEDDTFFSHAGFNWDAISKSFKLNYKNKKYLRGASTITQQLARNLFLTRDKSLIRKLREALLTYKLEHTLSKERILELYLNYAEFGPNIYGLYAGSFYHFNTSPLSLSNSQAALLAAVLPNPKVYAHKPYPRITLWRQGMIVNRMARYDPLEPPAEDEKRIVKKDKKEKVEQKKSPVQIENTEILNTQPRHEVVEETDVPPEEIEKMEKEAEFLDE